MGKATFCANGHAQLCQLCHVKQSDVLNVYHSQAHLFLSFHLSVPVWYQLWRLSQLQQSSVTLEFPLPSMIIITDATPSYLGLLFLGFWVSFIL